MKSVYDLQLHEIITLGKKIRIMRVPGGWIYERVIRKISDTDFEVVTTFVPYNEDLKGA